MKRIKKKCSVCLGLRKNEQGFTYLSILLCLVIVAVTMPILIYFLQVITSETNDSHIIAHQFFSYISSDISQATQVTTNKNKLYMQLASKETSVLEKNKEVIRRRVDGKGHEIYIRDVQSLEIETLDYGIWIAITLLNGETYEKKFATE